MLDANDTVPSEQVIEWVLDSSEPQIVTAQLVDRPTAHQLRRLARRPRLKRLDSRRKLGLLAPHGKAS
jgi:hypothetical protein